MTVSLKTRTILGASLGIVVVGTVGWQLATLDQTSTSTSTSSGARPTVTLTDGTYTGTSVQTQFGDVEVQIVVSGGRITDATTPVLTGNEGRSEQINNQAAPILRSELLASQSTSIQSVSGATYTSNAYITSLQAAFDRAKA
ncbi:MAG: FMN-binding domain protein [Microbacteriaceae bacterium]|nr:FMN-binding domain protein [Microbacteriaceae bacterium]